MPDILKLLGIVPTASTGAYGAGGRSTPALDIPQHWTQNIGMGDTPHSFAPMKFFEALTDIVEPHKGGAKLLAKAGAKAAGSKGGLAAASAAKGGAAQLAALLGIGVPRRNVEFPTNIDIPLKMSGHKGGSPIDTQASLISPDEGPIAELTSLGDLTAFRPGGKRGQALHTDTTWGLGFKGLRKVMDTIQGYLPEKSFLKFDRAGGVQGAKADVPSAIGADLTAYREGRMRDVLLYDDPPGGRALTPREMEFIQEKRSFESQIWSDTPEPEPTASEVAESALDFIKKQFSGN